MLAYRDALWDAWQGIPRIRYAVPALFSEPRFTLESALFGTQTDARAPLGMLRVLTLPAWEGLSAQELVP
jgi:hypothetical protein